MSAPPSPRIGFIGKNASIHKKRGHVVGLAISDDGRQAISDGEVRYARDFAEVQDKSIEQHSFNLNVSAPDDPKIEAEHVISRSTSSSSSLDPYYFGLQSESDEPALPAGAEPSYLSTTPEHDFSNEPVTPARNPASIDRRGLVGVGELATPRWARDDRDVEHEEPPELPSDGDVEGYDVVVPEDMEEDHPDSPWTIEAIDGELSEKEEEEPNVSSQSRPLRTQRSIADESGGEEILYPRNLGIASAALSPLSPETPKVPRLPSRPPIPDLSPPSAFNPSNRKARKRSSGEFELDQTGSMSPKYGGPTLLNKDKDDKADARKHRSLGIAVPSTKPDGKTRDRRRESTGVGVSAGAKPSSFTSKPGDRHTRQSSASAVSPSVTDNHPPRRVHTTDFSHLPPSPSSTSIQQLLNNAPTTPSSQLASLQRSSKDNLRMHSSPNVAHSLLRGTQEGWSALDDDAAAEALRKLDGISGKGARARASVGSFGRPSSSSRPATPSGKSGSQWEGLSASDSGKSKRGSGGVKDSSSIKERADIGRGDNMEALDIADPPLNTTHEEVSLSLDKTPKKGVMPVRLSFTPKRGSTSSTTYASTPSSRDSASMSAVTSATSMSGVSGGRHSSNKGRRNSASSDVSAQSAEAAHVKDRVASIAVNGDGNDEANVPPVPPLPKDLSTYRSPPTTSSALTFPTIPSDDRDKIPMSDSSSNKAISLDVPQYSSPLVSPPSSARHDNHYYSSTSASEATPPVLKTPSKKWSFSSALNLKLGSPSSSSQKSSFPLSPRGVSFGQQLRKSTSKDQPLASSSSKGPWSPEQPDAMASAGSLASLSSIGSVKTPALPSNTAKTPDRAHYTSRPGTAGSSASNNLASVGLAAPMPGPLSPTSSIRRGASKRLTPSSIPFFRRSSSQSMQVPPLSGALSSTSPNSTSTNMLSASQPRTKQSSSPAQDYNSISTSTPGTTHKKSSILGLLKSSSRKSLHSDAKDAAKEMQKAKESARESEKERAKLEKEKQKKEAKDRSESRISVMINRKRGKTLSSTDPRKPKSPVNLPPMQMSALEPVTAQRVAKLKSVSNVAPSSSMSARTSTSSSSSRLTSQTVSSLQKQSDTSLRTRNQLPTIAGSPSVGTTGSSSSQTLKDNRDLTASLLNSTSGLPKETPTKIPRISSRTSAVPSPPGKNSTSVLTARRTSALAVSSSTNPSPTSFTTNEFGVIDNDDGATPKMRQPSVRSSPSGGPTPRLPRQPLTTTATAPTSSVTRKSNRDSVSFIGLRKSSTNSTASLVTSGTGNESSSSHHRFSLLSSTKASNAASLAQPSSSANDSSSSHRFSILSPSKGLKLVTPKSAAKASAAAASQTGRQNVNSPSSSRQSLSTPSPVPSTVDEEELLGDEEMMQYIRRQHAKKLASGATQAELDELLKFPEPTAPTVPLSPATILKGPQAQALAEYERKEILDYPSVYYYGADSRKKPAVLDNPTNNYGYDDERGDYLIVNHDHLAYRYEIIDTLGKGSFGQVLNCRDHSTGESVAVKIIRNKKRFHHQALVEIKILDNLRKWDSDEKHHVIKMTEHFYFRNHLCIAMELLSINLYELIKANGFVGFTTALIRRFTSQMLLSLSLMRHHRIVHCDLKPENVLLRHPSKSGIKVIDFGSSCFDHEKIYTYIQSRFYRSPEVILGMNYHMAIDMWSLGCILAELYTGFPIFPGENEQEQLSCIMEVLGVPDKEFINRSSRKKLFFDQHGAPRTVINSKGRRRRPGTKTLAQVLRCNDEEFVDFIAKCLVWDPERRMKPQAALRHPFIASGRRSRPPGIAPKSTASSSTLGLRSKQVTETPKKSLISAPTPLTARSSRTNGGPTTPSNSHAQPPAPTSAQTSRSYRASQSQSLASYNSSRTLSGYASTSNK